MGCSVLNSLHRLDILLVEICFIYTLKLRIGDHLSMSAHSPRLQFVTRLLDSPKMEAKGVVLVKGPWYEIPGSLGASFQSEPVPYIPRCVFVPVLVHLSLP